MTKRKTPPLGEALLWTVVALVTAAMLATLADKLLPSNF